MAGALLVPSTLALIVDTFDEDERAAAIGTWTAWTGVATVIGPLGGGVLVQAASWRWIFLDQPDPGGDHRGCCCGGCRPTSARPVTSTRSAALLCVLGLGGPVFGLIEQSRYGWGDPRVAIPIARGIVLLAAFVAWERRVPAADDAAAAVHGAQLRGRQPHHADAVRRPRRGDVLLVVFLQQVGGYTPIAAGARRCCRSRS